MPKFLVQEPGRRKGDTDMANLDIDLARIHTADLLAEAEREGLTRLARSARPSRTIPGGPVARLAVTVAVSVVLALRALRGTI
jgi:hypothetical protein